MKKYTIHLFLLAAVVGFLFFYAGSCSKGNDYYVRFMANGEEVEFGLGLSDMEENAFANIIGPAEDNTLFVATPESVDSSSQPGTYIWILIYGTSPGMYVFGETAGLFYSDASTLYDVQSGSVNVTSFGDVGGTIEGTFEATVTEILAGGLKGVKQSLGVLITDGSFRVKRIADNTFNPFPSE